MTAQMTENRRTELRARLDLESGPASARLAVALDFDDLELARRLVDSVGSRAGVYKIGLELIYRGGLALAERLVGEGHRVFIDGKLYDIGNTVAGAVRSVRQIGPSILTLQGDQHIVAAARAAADEPGDRPAPALIAITLLTSQGTDDLAAIGIGEAVPDFVARRARVALAAGADGLVVAGGETESVRRVQGARSAILVTPGVRSPGVGAHDQKRVTTPADAVAGGSDIIVVGREITRAENPAGAADRVLDGIVEGLSKRAA